jgi:hypothetical protein
MSDFNAPAELHRVEMAHRNWGHSLPTSPRMVHAGSVAECVTKVMGKRDPDRRIYSLTVDFAAGFGKAILEYDDIEAIAARKDFPRKPIDV